MYPKRLERARLTRWRLCVLLAVLSHLLVLLNLNRLSLLGFLAGTVIIMHRDTYVNSTNYNVNDSDSDSDSEIPRAVLPAGRTGALAVHESSQETRVPGTERRSPPHHPPTEHCAPAADARAASDY